jgi:hypothetical protein
MAQLAEMGIAIPDEYRGDMSLAGEWQTLSETKIEDLEGAAKSIGVRKRKHDGDEEDEEDEGGNPSERLVSKGWGSRMRVYPGAQNDDDEEGLDALLASTKELKKSKAPLPDADLEESKSVEELKPELVSSVKKEEEAAESPDNETDSTAHVKTEEPSVLSAALTEEKPPIEDAPGPVFKKRKAKVMRK